MKYRIRLRGVSRSRRKGSKTILKNRLTKLKNLIVVKNRLKRILALRRKRVGRRRRRWLLYYLFQIL